MSHSPSESPTRKSCEEYMREADALMAQKQWREARMAYEAARDSAETEMAALSNNDADNERRIVLEGQLSVLNENNRDYGRIAMADDYRRRVVGLREWVRARLEGKNYRSAVILNLRHELALNSIPDYLKPKVTEVIDYIAEKEQVDRDKVSNVVYAYLTHIFNAIDEDNEEGFIDIAMELPDDDMYTKDRRLTRPNNRMAIEERIINRAVGILKKDDSRRLVESNQNKLKELIEDVLVFMEIRESDEHWQRIADSIRDAIAKGEGEMPPDLRQ